MNRVRILGWVTLAASIVAGTIAPSEKKEPITIDSYRVLAADFHVHAFPGDWALAPPWEAVKQAERDGIDVVSLAGQNSIWKGKLTRSLMTRSSGPIVMVGEEIVTPTFHLLVTGINEAVSWRQSARNALDEIHRQGGIAIAAHPAESFWPAYDAEAMQVLDAAEILHPSVRTRPGYGEQLQKFALRGHPAAIGDSDWRFGPVGWCRTYVFAKDATEQSVLEAIRNRRTVVYDRGRWFGDERLIEAAQRDGRLAYEVERGSHPLEVFSRFAGSLGLLTLVFVPNRRR